MDHKLIRSLRRAGKHVEMFSFTDGSKVLLLPYGGRILGLYSGDDERNFYWVNPELYQSASARAFFSSGRWQNTGGERTWLGPEIDFFFPRFPDLTSYVQPRPLDSFEFRLTQNRGNPTMAAEFSVRSIRRHHPLKLRLTKSIEPAANPLRAERDFPALKRVEFAGYRTRAVLEFSSQSVPAATVGLWDIIQMPHDGQMLIPTYGRAKPRVFFGHVPRGDLSVTPALVRYRMRSSGDHKIGLRAHSTTGRIAYHYRSNQTDNLVIKNFFGNPSGEYCDAPFLDPCDSGYGVEACSVNNSELGRFSELEYHSPAIGGRSGLRRMEDVAQVWAYRGPPTQIALVAKRLLGVSSRTL